MLKSIGVVLGSYALSIVLVLATDPLLSRLFPGDFVKGHIPSNPALATSTGSATFFPSANNPPNDPTPERTPGV